MRRICVFCGSNGGARPSYLAAARAMGVLLAERGIGVVFGGGRVGMMGAVADAALAAGGEVIGVIPHALVARELAHEGVTELVVVQSMHERKAKMAELADGFVALPGGFGTLEEMFEVLTWGQLGLHEKPCALLDVEGYFAALLAFLEHAVRERFLREEHRSVLLADSDPERLLTAMARYAPPVLEKWIDRDQT